MKRHYARQTIPSAKPISPLAIFVIFAITIPILIPALLSPFAFRHRAVLYFPTTQPAQAEAR